MNGKINCLFYSLLSPLITHQIHYLALRMDNMTLWFYRYLSGGAFLILFILMFKRNEAAKLFRSKWTFGGLVIYALMLIVSSFAFSEGVKLTNATTGNLFCSISLPLTMGMAYAIWREESDLFKNYFFHIGLMIVLFGTIGFSLSGGEFTVGSKFTWGILMLLGGIINSCCSTLLMRRLLFNNDPLAVSGVGMSIACLILFIPTFMEGGMNAFSVLSMETVGILLFSGIFGASIGFLLGLLILKRSGIMIYNLLQLLIPIISAVIGVSFLKESFRLNQLFFGIVLLAGCYLCLKCKKRTEQARLMKDQLNFKKSVFF